jgi:hypothetical protein
MTEHTCWELIKYVAQEPFQSLENIRNTGVYLALMKIPHRDFNKFYSHFYGEKD